MMPQRVHPTSNDPASNMQTGARVALAGMIVNFVLAVAKIAAGLLGNSYVLIADGIESALDIAGSAVIWGGLKFAARPPDATHPYGHGKAEPMAAGHRGGGCYHRGTRPRHSKCARNFHCRTTGPLRSRSLF